MNIDPVEWTGSLQVNDAARPGSFVNIYPGDKFYVRTQVSSGWTMSGVYTFTLQNSDQVCHLGGIMQWERVGDITDPIYYIVETFPEILTVAVFEPIPTVIVP